MFDIDTATAYTWEGAPAYVQRDAWGTIVTLPEGHADLGYAPGSRFYAADSDALEAVAR